MKNYIILILSIYSPLQYCMEKQIEDIKLELREWDAKSYDEGNWLQTNAFLHFLKNNKIITENRTILDAGCGTGKIAARLAKKARSVHGFDASNNMITVARINHKNITNVTFEQCFAEEFTSQKLYQLGIMSSCFHWFQNKEKALQRIYKSLEIDGEFFADIHTTQDPVPLNLTVFNEMKNDITAVQEYFNNYPSKPCDNSYLSLNELKEMLCNTGFDIIKAEIQSFNCIMTKKEFRKFQLPIAKSRPGIKNIPEATFNKFFAIFIDRCLSKLEKSNNNTYKYPFTTTIVHARKVNK